MVTLDTPTASNTIVEPASVHQPPPTDKTPPFTLPPNLKSKDSRKHFFSANIEGGGAKNDRPTVWVNHVDNITTDQTSTEADEAETDSLAAKSPTDETTDLGDDDDTFDTFEEEEKEAAKARQQHTGGIEESKEDLTDIEALAEGHAPTDPNSSPVGSDLTFDTKNDRVLQKAAEIKNQVAIDVQDHSLHP